MPYVAFGMPGPAELGIILVIVLLLFGAGKLPSVLGELGKGIRTFRDASTEPEDDAVPRPSRRQITRQD